MDEPTPPPGPDRPMPPPRPGGPTHRSRPTGADVVVRRPDPGSRRAAMICGVLVAVLIGLVAVMQQTLPASLARSVGQPAPAPGAPLVERAPFEFEFTAKMLVKLREFFGEQGGAITAEQLELGAESPAQQLRLAIVEAELGGGPQKAVERIDAAEPLIPDDSPLREDAAILRRIYSAEEGADPPSAEDLAELEARHGWFARLAAVYGRETSDPARRAVVGGGGAIFAALMVFLAVAGLACAAGLVLFIIGVSFFASGRLRTHFVPPLKGGSVAIETVAVFVGGFALLKLVTLGAEWAAGEATAGCMGLVGQWALLGAILWPLARGVSFAEMAAMFGLHRGRGFWREAGAGILGYLGCLPFLVLGIGATLLLLFLQEILRRVRGEAPAPPPQNEVFEIVAGGQSLFSVVLFMLLASLWAPLAEETIFRGALYRHLRSRLRWDPAAILTALAFGLMHGYPLILLGPVIGLGFGFSLVREWRGSLVGPMVAHGLHNAAVVTLLVTLGRLVE